MSPDEPLPPKLGKSLLTPKDCLQQIVFFSVSTLGAAACAMFALHEGVKFASLMMAFVALGALAGAAKMIWQYRLVKQGQAVYVNDNSPARLILLKTGIVLTAALLSLAVAGALAIVVIIYFNAGRPFAWEWLPASVGFAVLLLAGIWLLAVRIWRSIDGKSDGSRLWKATLNFSRGALGDKPRQNIVTLPVVNDEAVWPPPPTRGQEEEAR